MLAFGRPEVIERFRNYPLDTDPQGRTVGQFWDDIDTIRSKQEFQRLTELDKADRFRAYDSHLGTLYEAINAPQNGETKFAVYKRITDLDDLTAEERLSELLNFYKEYLQLFLILTEEKGYPESVTLT